MAQVALVLFHRRMNLWKPLHRGVTIGGATTGRFRHTDRFPNRGWDRGPRSLPLPNRPLAPSVRLPGHRWQLACRPRLLVDLTGPNSTGRQKNRDRSTQDVRRSSGHQVHQLTFGPRPPTHASGDPRSPIHADARSPHMPRAASRNDRRNPASSAETRAGRVIQDGNVEWLPARVNSRKPRGRESFSSSCSPFGACPGGARTVQGPDGARCGLANAGRPTAFRGARSAAKPPPPHQIAVHAPDTATDGRPPPAGGSSASGLASGNDSERDSEPQRASRSRLSRRPRNRPACQKSASGPFGSNRRIDSAKTVANAPNR